MVVMVELVVAQAEVMVELVWGQLPILILMPKKKLSTLEQVVVVVAEVLLPAQPSRPARVLVEQVVTLE